MTGGKRPYNRAKHNAYNRAYAARPEQIAKRAKRNAARRAMVKAGKARKGDGREIDHVKAIRNGGSNAIGNLRSVSEKKNAGWRKGRKGYG